MISEMMMADEQFIMTEVGAYEAIHSDRDRDQAEDQTTIATASLVNELYDVDLDGSSHTGDPILQPIAAEVPTKDNSGGSRSGKHAHTHKQTLSSAQKQPKTLKCPQCRRYFCTEEELQAHQIVRHSAEMNERFKCFECNQAFSSQGSLYKHQKIHTGEKPFVCETCLKSFNQLANLQRHFMVHTGEKPFACKTCGKQFSQQSNVDKHQVTHSKLKPFVCNICNKQFTQRANLQKHERVHTGERPYGCPICRKSYAQHSNLKKHILTHNKPNDTMAYLCAKCKKLFDTVLLYDAHLDYCDGENTDFNFEMVTVTNELNGDGGELEDEPSGSALEMILGGTTTDAPSNKINILNVIKTEDTLDELLNDNDNDPCLMQHVEYLDE